MSQADEDYTLSSPYVYTISANLLTFLKYFPKYLTTLILSQSLLLNPLIYSRLF